MITTGDLAPEFADCHTPDEIEAVFQRIRIIRFDRGWRDAARRAGNARADAIADRAAFGQLYPRRLDKGTGHSQRWQIGEEVFRTGTWGNGAGYRWMAHDRDEWMATRMRAGGVPEDRIRLAVEWMVEDYRWRCLGELWKPEENVGTGEEPRT